MSTLTKTDDLTSTSSIPLHLPVCIRFFDEALEEELHRGIVMYSQGERFTVQALEIIATPEQSGAEIYYRDEDHKFVRVLASLTDSHIEDQRSTLEMILMADQGKCAEQRGSFRVSVVNQGMTVVVGGQQGCRALDVSAEGLGVISPQQLEIGQEMSVQIEFDGQHINKPMVVRTVRKRKDKKFRCGLQVPDNSSDLTKSLQTIAMSVQREFLCRLSAIGTMASKKLGGDIPAVTDRTTPIAKGHRPSRPTEQRSPGSGAEQTRKASSQTPQVHSKYLMLHLPLRDLIGKRMQGHLRDSSGRIVVSKNDVLSAATVASLLQTPPYIGGDWLKPMVHPGEQEDLQTGDERRKNIRRAWQMKMQVDLKLQGFAQRLDTTTVDLSRGGFSFIANRNVPKGTTVSANITVGGSTRKIKGVVRSCTKSSTLDHRISVQFADQTS